MSKLNSFELEEYRQEIVSMYDTWLQKTEDRCISYGELAHIDSLSEQELAEMETELEKELELV